ncbi:MAG: glycosyl transferase family 1, partial [Chloroflexota bacterium]|nr:glycosyl transferase family 1 [Chloroflexota bacterium]
MKILFLTPQLPYPPHQGTTIRNYNLMRALAQRYTIDLLTFLAPGATLDASNPLHTLCRRVIALPQPSRSATQRILDTLRSPRPDMGLRLDYAPMHKLVQQWV